jgi:hypothetical protein
MVPMKVNFQFKAGDKVRLRINEVHHLIFGLLTQEEKSRSLPMTEMM